MKREGQQGGRTHKERWGCREGELTWREKSSYGGRTHREGGLIGRNGSQGAHMEREGLTRREDSQEGKAHMEGGLTGREDSGRENSHGGRAHMEGEGHWRKVSLERRRNRKQMEGAAQTLTFFFWLQLSQPLWPAGSPGPSAM